MPHLASVRLACVRRISFVVYGQKKLENTIRNLKFHENCINLFFFADKNNFTSRVWEIITKSVTEYSNDNNDEDNDDPLTKNQQKLSNKNESDEENESSELEDLLMVDNETQTEEYLNGKY